MKFVTIAEAHKELVINGIHIAMELLEESKGEVDIAGVVDWGNQSQTDEQNLNEGHCRLSEILCLVEDDCRLTGDQLGCILSILRDGFYRYRETDGVVDRLSLDETGHGIIELQEMIAHYSGVYEFGDTSTYGTVTLLAAWLQQNIKKESLFDMKEYSFIWTVNHMADYDIFPSKELLHAAWLQACHEILLRDVEATGIYNWVSGNLYDWVHQLDVAIKYVVDKLAMDKRLFGSSI